MNIFIPPCLLIKMRDRKIFRMLFQLVMQSNQSFSQIIWRTKGRKLRNGQDLTAKRYFYWLFGCFEFQKGKRRLTKFLR